MIPRGGRGGATRKVLCGATYAGSLLVLLVLLLRDPLAQLWRSLETQYRCWHLRLLSVCLIIFRFRLII